jgi:hypothetical protein
VSPSSSFFIFSPSSATPLATFPALIWQIVTAVRQRAWFVTSCVLRGVCVRERVYEMRCECEVIACVG